MSSLKGPDSHTSTEKQPGAYDGRTIDSEGDENLDDPALKSKCKSQIYLDFQVNT